MFQLPDSGIVVWRFSQQPSGKLSTLSMLKTAPESISSVVENSHEIPKGNPPGLCDAHPSVSYIWAEFRSHKPTRGFRGTLSFAGEYWVGSFCCPSLNDIHTISWSSYGVYSFPNVHWFHFSKELVNLFRSEFCQLFFWKRKFVCRCHFSYGI